MSKRGYNIIGPLALTILVWGSGIYVLLVSYMPYNPMTPSDSFRQTLALFVMENWAFFTRDAREPNMFLYQKDDEGNLELHKNFKNNSTHNLFGLSREARSLSVEIGGLLRNVDSISWTKIETNDLSELFSSSKTVTVRNGAYHPKLKDTVYIEIREKIPWAWIESYDDIEMPAKTVKLFIPDEDLDQKSKD